MSAIEVQHISKTFGSTIALRDVSLQVEDAELFGLIGPDGAGKSTLFRILTTLLLPDQGTAAVAGHSILEDHKAIRSRVGYMPGKFSLYQDLSIEENLNFFATIFSTSVEENYDLIKDIYIQIEPFKDRLAGKLSGGMKQKLALCCALIHKPKVLFLDEPTTGVDAVSRKEFWEMLKTLREKKIAVLVSTPYMDEAILCDRIALIQDGEILSIESPGQMISGFKKSIFAIKGANTYELLKVLRELAYTESALPFGEFIHFIPRYEVAQERIRKDLEVRSQSIFVIKSIQPTIEDIFLDLGKQKTMLTNESSQSH